MKVQPRWLNGKRHELRLGQAFQTGAERHRLRDAIYHYAQRKGITVSAKVNRFTGSLEVQAAPPLKAPKAVAVASR